MNSCSTHARAARGRVGCAMRAGHVMAGTSAGRDGDGDGADPRALNSVSPRACRLCGGRVAGTPGVELHAPRCDYTPAAYLTLLFTDLGVLTPAAVSDELIKLYQ